MANRRGFWRVCAGLASERQLELLVELRHSKREIGEKFFENKCEVNDLSSLGKRTKVSETDVER